MSFRTFSLQSVVVGTNKCLTSDVTIAFTVAPAVSSSEATDRDIPLVAWKVLRFSSGSVEVKQLRLYSSRRIGVADMQDEGSFTWVRMSDNGAGLGPNQHLSISASGRWSSHVLFELSQDSSFITNNSSRPLLLSVGTRAPSSSFEPMALLPDLQHEEGILVRYPYMMQAYNMTGTECIEGGILNVPSDTATLQERALMRDSAGNPEPMDTRKLREDIAFHVYSGVDGTLVLEQINQPKRVPIPRPPPLPHVLIPSSPLFGSPVRSPIPMRHRPQTPNFLLSPGFNMSWAHPTPPLTPSLSLPGSPPLSAGSPGFLSPLRTPSPENGSQFFMSS